MKKLITLTLAVILGLIVCNASTAQMYIPKFNKKLLDSVRYPPSNSPLPSIPGVSIMPEPSQPTPQPTPQPPNNIGGGGVIFDWGPGGPSLGIPSGGGRFNVPLRPRHNHHRPIYQSPGQVLGYGPQGQVYTGNGQVMQSALTPGRNMSQYNGTQRVVQQPIHDNFGNVIGYRQGTVWNNSLTGQQHGAMTTYTPNGTGGYHQSTTQYSTAGGNITPMIGK